MTIPIIIPILVVALFAIFYAVLTGFRLYHVYSFGAWDKVNIGVAAVFLVVSLMTFALMIFIIAVTDWSRPLFEVSLPTLPTF